MGTMKNTLVHMANGLHRLEQLLQRMINKQEQKQMKKNRTVLYKQGTFLVTV